MGSGESGPMDLGGAQRSRSPSAASPVAFWLISPVLPAKPSAAGSPGRGGARERSQFSPSGGNGDKRTLRRRAATGKVTRRPQAAKPPLRKPSKRRVREAAPYRGAEISKGGRCTPQGGFSCPFGAIHLQPFPYKKWAKKVEKNGRRRNSLHFLFTFTS